MYSQNNEEEIILNYLGTASPSSSSPRRFLDIGAYDGRTFSNTLKLVELGWHGVCVEPSPGPFVRLIAEHKDRPHVQLVHAAITAEEPARLVTFHDSGGDAVSTLEPAHVQRWSKSGVAFKPFWTLTLPLASLFAQFGTDYEFLNLDVESVNIDIFRKLPFAAMTGLRLICVEHDRHIDEIRTLAGQFGFHEIGFNAENLILAK